MSEVHPTPQEESDFHSLAFAQLKLNIVNKCRTLVRDLELYTKINKDWKYKIEQPINEDLEDALLDIYTTLMKLYNRV